jgi:protein CpxP
MSRYARFLGLTVIAITLAATASMAQSAGQQPRQRGQRFMAGLNLTDMQRDQIRTLREQHRTAIRDQALQLRDARRALRVETFADSPDQAKIDSLQQQVATLSQQMEASRLELDQQIAKFLTPEQRKYMREHTGQMRQLRGRRMNRGRF